MSRNYRVLVPPHIARLMAPDDRKANGIETPEEEDAPSLRRVRGELRCEKLEFETVTPKKQ